jgi:hypothetical protein
VLSAIKREKSASPGSGDPNARRGTEYRVLIKKLECHLVLKSSKEYKINVHALTTVHVQVLRVMEFAKNILRTVYSEVRGKMTK